jgi:hypothetical protein
VPAFEVLVRAYGHVPELDRQPYLRARADTDLAEPGGKAYARAAAAP